MSRYKFHLRDYHAIQDADIIIDGITVLSGVNGCGKSTISRWLYYIIKGTTHYEDFLMMDFIEKIRNVINRMIFVSRDIERFNRVHKFERESSQGKLYVIQEKLEQITTQNQRQIELANDLFSEALSIMEELLRRNLDENMSDARKERIMNYLNIPGQGISAGIEGFIEQYHRLINKFTFDLHREIEERKYKSFFEALRKHFSIDEEHPTHIQLEEDGVNVIDEHISSLYNLQDAIYIDTPMSVTSESSDNIFWDALKNMINDDKKVSESIEVKIFLARIQKLLDGTAVLDKDDSFISSNDLRYVSNDGEINIKLSEVATGFKTFSYLQRLLENGYLNNETLLMIDEPEAHLHPQWIVEFARILVLLHKNLGLKIMIASHNPDMVAAIHDIAEKEGVIEQTNFYVAEKSEGNKHQFIYKDLNHNINEIFDSFNIALDRIKEYGATDLC